MEFEIDEFAVEQRLVDQPWESHPNHSPEWSTERIGMGQTGIWIPEEGRALSAKRIAPPEPCGESALVF